MIEAPTPDLNALIRVWRQGDCVPEKKDFLFQVDPVLPLTAQAREAVAVDPSTEFVVQQVLPADRSSVLADWLERLIPAGPFVAVDGRMVHYEDFKASEYVDSDGLDLGQFSPDDL